VKLVCWNINSIKVRLPRLLGVLQRHRPDVVCLQETKCQDENFPTEALQDAGYHVAAHGQKAYNGVAILAKTPLQDVMRGFADPALDAQARLLAASVQGVRIVCVYVPNGQSRDSEKYPYKQAWLARLQAYLRQQHTPQEPLLVCGDINIAPRACDVAQPKTWENSVMFHPEMRQAFAQLCSWGLTDLFAAHHPEGGAYSWWDYRRLGFAKDNGLRIDHLLATAPLAARCTHTFIDRDERRGEQPSDHAPVGGEFATVPPALPCATA
jgi:exodeoxyribonuclease-3